MKLYLEVLCHGQRLLVLIFEDLFLLLDHFETGELRFTHFYGSLLLLRLMRMPCYRLVRGGVAV